MKHSPLVFLAALIALAASWCGFVLAPQVQVGREAQTQTLGSGDLYPQSRPGLAKQGLEVYRANGCVYCHSQQIGQEGSRCEIVLSDAGTNRVATAAAVAKLNAEWAKTDPKELLAGLPKTILQVPDMNAADPDLQALRAAGAKAEARLVLFGPDIARGWGRRRSVARDYLFDYPVQPGSQRIGPDLSNVGLRLPDVNWHLRHLYVPSSEVKGSTMPAYQFLFEIRKVGREPSPDALKLPAEVAPRAGYEIVATPEAKALVAYLVSLRADAPLLEAPLTPAVPIAAASNTNAPAATSSVK